MRRKVCLNGEWNFMPDYVGQNPDDFIMLRRWEKQKIKVPSSWRFVINKDASYQPYDMFGYPEEWNNAESGVLYREIDVERKGDERVILLLEGALQRSIVYINDVKANESHEAFLPVEVDITDYIRDKGKNGLKVWCGSFAGIHTETGKKNLAPSGSWFANMARGIWQDTYIEYRPNVYIKNVGISTSTRNLKIAACINILNKFGQYYGVVKVRVLDNNNTVVKEFQTCECSFKEGGETSLLFDEQWADAVWWSPENPHLYFLETEIIVDGKIADTLKTRFGFREVWTNEHKFYLNGVRMNLRGDAWHYQGFVQQNREYAVNWYKLCRDTGINFVRLHAMPYPGAYLDAADETGMLVVDESAIYGSGKVNNGENSRFIENCHNHLKMLLLRDRNHPSVIIWSMQNEMRWIEGRDGYKEAMKELVRTIKDLDGTRPVSFDGDNRLVDDEDMEIVSMHYNIDGTVAAWDKKKPLIFGEHGKWHYISPQVSTAFGGPEAYASFDKCLESIGLEEKLFIEYVRNKEVTGISPFNICNYMMRTMPLKDVRLKWKEHCTSGVKPDLIKSRSLCINNGYIENEPVYRPNPSWKHLKEAFKPVAVIPNEYNTSFFGGVEIYRSYSIYNDTEKEAACRIEYNLENLDGQVVCSGKETFPQMPGERKEFKAGFSLPDVREMETLGLNIRLYHGDTMVHTLDLEYKIYPHEYKNRHMDTQGKQIAFAGEEKSFVIISSFLDKVTWLPEITQDSIKNFDFLIIGKAFMGRAIEIQPVLEKFVSEGGFLLILEQDSFVPGEVTLSGRRYFNAYINDNKHPVFNGLADCDLQFWGEGNINEKDCRYMVQNAFNKPVQGNFKILLECGEGDFGWGGLLWTPMLEYSIGLGKVVMNQIELIDNFDVVPQACVLLRNLVDYGLEYVGHQKYKAGLITMPGSDCESFFKDLGLEYTVLSDRDSLVDYKLVILDPDLSDEWDTPGLYKYMENSGKLFVLPVRSRHKNVLESLAKTRINISASEVYQVKACPGEITRGISAHDLYHFEKVTYSPANKENVIICDTAVEFIGENRLFESVKNPWYQYYIKKFDAEFMKMAIADMVEEEEFSPSCFGIAMDIGKGMLLISQIKLSGENDKIKRIYARLLGNLGISIDTRLLNYVKEEKDYGIGAFMALPYREYNDYEKEEAYFSDNNYILNNLGEGVYGWMKRVDKKDGIIAVPESAGKIYFLTVFIESDINRNPVMRGANELPDSSIVPDAYIDINCPFKLFVNAHLYANRDGSADIKINDIVLNKGINRMLLVCKGGSEDVRFRVCFKNKYGDYMNGLKYYLTLD